MGFRLCTGLWVCSLELSVCGEWVYRVGFRVPGLGSGFLVLKRERGLDLQNLLKVGTSPTILLILLCYYFCIVNVIY